LPFFAEAIDSRPFTPALAFDRLLSKGRGDRSGGGPEAAGVIHTDFQRGFIKAEVAGRAEFRYV
jgi:hypothetical protein